MSKRTLESRHDFRDMVVLALGNRILGIIVGIRFTESKVFYDVETEYQTFTNVDSVFVEATTGMETKGNLELYLNSNE